MPEPIPPPTPSFNGRLDRFGFSASRSKAMPIGSTDGSEDTSSAVTSPPLRKRKSSKSSTLIAPTPKRTSTVVSPTTSKPSLRSTVSPSSPSPSPSPLSKSRSRSRRPSSTPKSWTASSHTSPDKYASHPNLLTDSIRPNLYILFIGVNPGLTTALTGHAYAHPTNLFWRLLHSSGITPILHSPSDTHRLPDLYNYGNTNIVSRTTKDASELSRAEMDAGVPVLEDKIAHARPEAVCIVGKSIWEAIWRVKTGKPIRKDEFRYGWQDDKHNMGIADTRPEGWKGARVFVGTTTSGLAATMSKAEKERVWRELGAWAEGRRKEWETSNRKHVQEELPGKKG